MAILLSERIIKMDNKNYMDLIGRYLSGGITAAEKAVLMAWVEESSANRKFFDEMIQLWSVSSHYEDEPFNTDVEAAWSTLEHKLEQRSSGGKAGISGQTGGAKVLRMGPMSRMLRYAAAIALLLAAGYWVLNRFDTNPEVQVAEVRTGLGEQQEVILPDGSKVLLNENTQITYAEPFEERRVQLSGEAFFEVQKMNGKPFSIEAEGSTTTVLGTSFNVRAYPQDEKVVVSVRTGKVALEQSGNAARKVLLEPGETGVYIKAEEVVEETAVSNPDSWKTQRLDFDSVRLEEAVEAVERYFNAEVEVGNAQLLNCHFTGHFVQPKSLQEVLEAMAFTMDLQVAQQEGVFYLKGDASRCR